MNKNKYPRITVITPSFNQGDFLKQTIKSVLSQNYPNLEYIIIDGGSTDDSVSIIEKFGKMIDYWVSEKDKGQTDAINKGLELATGELVTWINSDDLLLPNSLFEISKIYFKNKPDLISASCIRIDEKNKYLYTHCVPKQLKFFTLRGMIYIDQPGTFWNKNFLNNKFLDQSLEALMDHDLWYKLTLNKCKSVSLNYQTAAFRIHSESKTSTIMPQFKIEDVLLRKKYINLEKPSFLSITLYRLYKLSLGYYFKSFIKTKFPSKELINFLNK
ncbi:glycosyltransferase [Flavobacteriaceae bacterium]|nr:glycosyltransferase [Flavobacteriaceae bacterium]